MKVEEVFSQINQFWHLAPTDQDPRKGTILIDLMHGNLEYLQRALVIANFIKIITGRKMFGINGYAGVVARSTVVNTLFNRELAKAFHVEELIEIPDRLPLYSGSIPLDRIIEIVGRREDQQFFEIEDLEEFVRLRDDRTGLNIGRIIQETFMRSELVASLQYGPKLKNWCENTAAFDKWAEALISTLPQPIVFVSGHIDYSPWGHIALRVIRAGGRVVWYRCDNRTPVSFIDNVHENDTLNSVIRRSEAESFTWFESALKEASLIEICDIWSAKLDSIVHQGFGRNWRWTSPQSGAVTMEFNRSRPTYIIFTHTFTDQPAADWSLFPDHFTWLDQTLARAAECKLYNLMVKVHPFDSHFDCSDAMNVLEQRYHKYDNIIFTRSSIGRENIVRSFDAGITVRGTPGLEMTAAGLPMVLAGGAAYGDCGFCINPSTRDAYFELLERGDISNCLDIDEAMRRARLYLAQDRFWSAPASPLCPPFIAQEANADWWTRVLHGLRSSDVATDPLLVAIAAAWPKRNTKVTNPSTFQAIVATMKGASDE